MVVADVETGIQIFAEQLLHRLWESYPSLVSDFVSDGHLPQVLQRLANNISFEEPFFCIQLTQQIWSLTAALNAEPLLVAATEKLVMDCHLDPSFEAQQPANYKQLAQCTQVS